MAIITVNGLPLSLPQSERLVTAKKHRVRGYAEWNPTTENRALMQAAIQVLKEYEAHLPLTCRQIFYRLIESFLAKTAAAYNRLCDVLNRARRARLIPFDHIRDDSIEHHSVPGYDSADDIVATVLSTLKYASLCGHDFQPVRQYVMCESRGMISQLTRVAENFDADVISSGGFDWPHSRSASAAT